MKSEEFAAAVHLRRIILCALLLGVVANPLLFISHSSFFTLHSSLFTLHSSLFTSSLLHAQNVQKGKASFYSKRATGARTANGERLHHDSMTCAHKTYPFGTMLKVTNLSNGKNVVVRVTDRGPYRKGRIIDLSWGAAKAIDMIAQGITQVIVERLPSTTIPFKPEELTPDLPVFEFDIAEISTGITPIWQVDKAHMKIDERKASKDMEVTAEKMKNLTEPDALPTTKKPQPKPAETKKDVPKKDVLDEINNSPNRSKAYLKRTGQ